MRVRRSLLLAVAAGTLLTGTMPVLAQTQTQAPAHHQGQAQPSGQVDSWPTRPVRWVVPFPPGGAMDRIARILGETVGRNLNANFVIENKPGAGGNIGATDVAKAAPDGQTLLITSIGMVTNQPLYGKLAYDPKKDFAPVSILAVVPNVLVVNQTLPAVKSVADVIADAK